MISDAAERPSDGEQTFGEWRPTDWTLRQRAAAIGSLLLLAGAYGLLAATATPWGNGANAETTFVPIGLTLLCVGTTWLSYVFWYAYKHGHNSVGDHASSMLGAYGMLVLAGLVALVTLVLQAAGAALVATVGWPGWQLYSPLSFLFPVAACILVSVSLAYGSQLLTWRPTRDPAAPGSALSAPVSNTRLLVRWVVMVLARNSWVLIAPVAYVRTIAVPVFPNGGGPDQAHGLLPMALPFALVGAALCFLLAALSELTQRP